MEHFRDKVAIVTGGGSGIGRALCFELGRRGAIVVVADIDGEAAGRVASEIAKSGGRASVVEMDVSRQESVDALVGRTESENGRLDFMFNNAGTTATGDARDLTLEHWRRVVEVNLWGVIYGTFAAYPVMVGQGHGHIVNTASVAGLVPFPTGLPYTTTKHAVVGLSTALRVEAADLGVRVSVVCPGFVESNIYQTAPVVNVPRDELNALVPFKKMDTTKAARAILRGVERNRAIIVFPPHARWLWRVYRLRAGLTIPIGLKVIRGFRALRGEP